MRSKLTPERHAEVIRNVSLGQPHRVAANLAYLGERTLERYLEQGRQADEAARAALDALPAPFRAAITELDDEPVPPPPEGSDAARRLLPDAVVVESGQRKWSPIAMARGDADPPYSRALLNMLPLDQWKFWRLWRAMKRADAAREAVYLARITEEGRGYATEESTTTTVEEEVDGKVVKRRTTTVTKRGFRRAWQANAFMLQNLDPERYGRYRGERGGVVMPPDEDDATPQPVTVGSMDDEKHRAFAGLDELAELRERREAAEAADAEAAGGET